MDVAFQSLAVTHAGPALRGLADDLEDDIPGGFLLKADAPACGSRRMVACSAVTITVRSVLSAPCSTQFSAPPGSRTRAQPSWVTMISTGCRPQAEQLLALRRRRVAGYQRCAGRTIFDALRERGARGRTQHDDSQGEAPGQWYCGDAARGVHAGCLTDGGRRP